jgi:hypothetical protein
VPYPQEELTYLGNVFNAKARAFYEKHGVKLIEEAYEAGNEKGMVSLMITRHCLRYSFNLCPKEVKHLKPDPMTLMNGNEADPQVRLQGLRDARHRQDEERRQAQPRHHPPGLLRLNRLRPACAAHRRAAD